MWIWFFGKSLHFIVGFGMQGKQPLWIGILEVGVGGKSGERKLSSVPWARLLLLLFRLKSCPTLCNPKDCSMPGFPILHHLPEFAQTCVLWVSDAIQPSHPLPLPSPPAFNLFHRQGPSCFCLIFPNRWQTLWGRGLCLSLLSVLDTPNLILQRASAWSKLVVLVLTMKGWSGQWIPWWIPLRSIHTGC